MQLVEKSAYQQQHLYLQSALRKGYGRSLLSDEVPLLNLPVLSTYMSVKLKQENSQQLVQLYI